MIRGWKRTADDRSVVGVAGSVNIHREVIRAVWHSSDRFAVGVIVLPWDSILGALERVIGGVVP